MTYVTSDLHGYPLQKFQALLAQAGFGEDDFLFILGDVIDRGEDGVEYLKWLLAQPNVQLILGNHEAMLLACDFLFQEVTDASVDALTTEKLRMLTTWQQNGAEPTLRALRQLNREDPDMLADVLDYLREAPLYELVRAGGVRFLLVHSGLGNFDPEKEIEDYDPHDLLWHRPGLEEQYFDTVTTVVGHTPTGLYGSRHRAAVWPPCCCGWTICRNFMQQTRKTDHGFAVFGYGFAKTEHKKGDIRDGYRLFDYGF